MNKIRVVTDSTADLPREIVDELEIIVVPLKVSFGTEVYRDGVDMTTREFIDRLEKDEEILPTTSQPSPGEFVAIYEKLIAKGDTIISIHLSGNLSGTIQSAQTAKTLTDSRDIYIIDSKSASMGLGLIVMAAARAAREGKTVREILAIVKDKIEKNFVLFLVDTLDYLEKGGRIGKAHALLGTILKIKPILTLDEEGQIVPLEKVRGKNRAIERIVEVIRERIDSSKRYSMALVYGNDYSGMVRLKDQILLQINCEEVLISELGPVIMSHTGPGLIGIIVCPY